MWQTNLTTTEENKIISSVTVPWAGVLEKLYADNARSATLVVTAEYNGKTYGGADATSAIQMTSQPASVVLAEPEDGLYQTDGGEGRTVPLTWTVPHLDTTQAGGGQFELYIAGGGLDGPIVETTVDGAVAQSGETYSYTLNVPAVELDTSDPTSYRDAYTITVKAKNAAESTWAYDS